MPAELEEDFTGYHSMPGNIFAGLPERGLDIKAATTRFYDQVDPEDLGAVDVEGAPGMKALKSGVTIGRLQDHAMRNAESFALDPAMQQYIRRLKKLGKDVDEEGNKLSNEDIALNYLLNEAPEHTSSRSSNVFQDPNYGGGMPQGIFDWNVFNQEGLDIEEDADFSFRKTEREQSGKKTEIDKLVAQRKEAVKEKDDDLVDSIDATLNDLQIDYERKQVIIDDVKTDVKQRYEPQFDEALNKSVDKIEELGLFKAEDGSFDRESALRGLLEIMGDPEKLKSLEGIGVRKGAYKGVAATMNVIKKATHVMAKAVESPVTLGFAIADDFSAFAEGDLEKMGEALKRNTGKLLPLKEGLYPLERENEDLK